MNILGGVHQSDMVRQVEEPKLANAGWKRLAAADLCDGVASQDDLWRVRIRIALTSSSSSVKIDNLGPCSFHAAYDAANGACHAVIGFDTPESIFDVGKHQEYSMCVSYYNLDP